MKPLLKRAVSLLLVGVLVSLLLGSPLLAAPDELLQNGGFEDPLGGEWKVSPYGDSLFQVPSPLREGSQGSFAAELTTDRTSWIYQTVPVSPEGTYTFSGWAVKNDPQIDWVYLQISWYESIDGMGEPIASHDSLTMLTEDDSTYQFLSIADVTAPLNAHSARVKGMVVLNPSPSGTVKVYFDDMSFQGPPPQPTPTPSPTPTATATPTSTPSPTPMPTSTLTPTPTPIPISSPIPSPSPSPVPISTPTPTAIPTVAPTPSEAKRSTPTPTVTGELLASGGFEEAIDGELAGWSKYGGTLVQTDLVVHSGEFAARFVSDTQSTKWIYQVVAVSPGDTYVLSGYALKNDSNIASTYLRISWYASPDAFGSQLSFHDSLTRLTDDDEAYRFLTTGDITPPPDARSAKARVMIRPVSNLRGQVYLDDISFLRKPSAPSPTPTLGPGSTPTSVPTATPTPTPIPTPTPLPTVTATPAATGTPTYEAIAPSSPEPEATEQTAATSTILSPSKTNTIAIIALAAVGLVGIAYWLRKRF